MPPVGVTDAEVVVLPLAAPRDDELEIYAVDVEEARKVKLGVRCLDWAGAHLESHGAAESWKYLSLKQRAGRS
jgi:hypothetical protein